MYKDSSLKSIKQLLGFMHIWPNDSRSTNTSWEFLVVQCHTELVHSIGSAKCLYDFTWDRTTDQQSGDCTVENIVVPPPCLTGSLFDSLWKRPIAVFSCIVL